MTGYMYSSRCRGSGNGLVSVILGILSAIFIILLIALPAILIIGGATLAILWYMDRRARKKLLQQQMIIRSAGSATNIQETEEGVYP